MKKAIVRNTLLTMACISLLVLSSCGTASSSNPVDQPSEQEFQTKDIDKRLLSANQTFAFQLYEQVMSEDAGNNVFISPLSVFIALSMTYNGAAAETKDAIANALQIQGLSVDEVNLSNAALKNVIEQADPDVQLSIANSLWGREGTPFKSDFLDQTERHYDARVTELDFNNPQASATINDWVSEQTNGKIEEIVESNIDPNTILFLINAIYFKGDWAKPFYEANTYDDEFHLLDGTTKTVPMMSQTAEFAYYNGKGFEAIQLPYGNERLSMTIFLPNADSSLEQLHEQLNAHKWREWMSKLKLTEGSIRLPRFQMEYEKQLNDILKALGMEIAFESQRANFERMADIPPNVYMKEVKHKSFIEVNEEGTEAAAATAVEMGLESASVYTFDMKVDRPFFFTIQENDTATPLFMGSVVEPE